MGDSKDLKRMVLLLACFKLYMPEAEVNLIEAAYRFRVSVMESCGIKNGSKSHCQWLSRALLVAVSSG